MQTAFHEEYKRLQAGFLIKSNSKTYEVVKPLSDNETNTGGAVYLVKEHSLAASSLIANQHVENKSTPAPHHPAHMMISGASK